MDKDLGRINRVECAAQYFGRTMVALGISLAFMVIAGLGAAIFFGGKPTSYIIAAAAIFGVHMAVNIGANDVANNMRPAVGANALTMGGAVVIVALYETAGALLAGGDAVSTISTGIIDPNVVANSQTFVWAMLAALTSSALWVNLATWVGAPVSTIHSVLGGVFLSRMAVALPTCHSQSTQNRQGRTPSPQAGTPVAFHDDRGRMDHHGTGRRSPVSFGIARAAVDVRRLSVARFLS